MLELDRTTGFCAIIGGYVIRDPALSDGVGRYVYGDNGQSQLRSAVLAKPRSKRVYVLKPSSRLATAGRRVRVRLAMSKKATRALRAALARRRRSVVTVTITARDSAGNPATRKLAIRARR